MITDRRRTAPVRLFVLGMLTLSLIAEICGCGGGGGSDALQGPLLAWPRARRNENNTATAFAGVGGNLGVAQLHFAFDDETPTNSAPIVGRDDTVYLATNESLLSIDSGGTVRWEVAECASTGDPMTFLSNPTIGPNGRDLIVGSWDPSSSAGGRIFWLRESAEVGSPPECRFAFPAGSRSAALTSVDATDLELISITTGTTTGRLVSIDRSGRRRWSFPEGEPFAGDLSSVPALTVDGVVFTAPDGRVHSVDPSGRPRWSARVGGPYSPDDVIPAPVSFGGIFTVSDEGDVVAFSSNGTRRWTFTPAAPIAGTLVVAPLTTEGGLSLDENVVFALDREGTVYGIGSNSGELIRFCETENRACRPSSCPDEAPCDSAMRCSDTDRECATNVDCPDGESCEEQFRCSNGQVCTPDQCVSDDAEDSGAGECKREAVHRVTNQPAEFRNAPILSTDAFIIAATNDGRVCARHLDGSVPGGTCNPSGASCDLDSCTVGDRCCGREGDPDPCAPALAKGRCEADQSRTCSIDTCPVGETCESPWAIDGKDGCIALDPAVGTTAFSSPSIDSRGAILVTTEKGLAKLQ